MTEFVGYISLADLKGMGAFTYNKSIIMATYMLVSVLPTASIGARSAE
ncbi:MAG: hypothetical protein R2744_07015 [Bacteroidales bacterium]